MLKLTKLSVDIIKNKLQKIFQKQLKMNMK